MLRTDGPNKLGGIFTILLTPFTEDGALDRDGVQRLVQHQREAGVDGLLVGGTYGEFPAMTTAERRVLLESVLDAADGELPVLACTAHSNPDEVAALTEHALVAGAFAAMVMPPYVSEVRTADVVRFFDRLRAVTGAPLVIYNTPGSGLPLAPADLVEIASVEGVIGVKQGVTSVSWFDETQILLGDRLRVMCASDLVLPAGLALGMHGATCTNASLLPELFVEIGRAVRENRWHEALQLHRSWAPLRTLLREFGQPQTTKAAMDLVGLPAGPVRRPLRPLDESQRRRLAMTLDSIGVMPVRA